MVIFIGDMINLFGARFNFFVVTLYLRSGGGGVSNRFIWGPFELLPKNRLNLK
jgi:hypothetical protein